MRYRKGSHENRDDERIDTNLEGSEQRAQCLDENHMK